MDAENSSRNRFNITPGLRSQQYRADEIGVHRITLTRARAAGDLACYKVGDRVLISDEQIADWLERHERPARKVAA